MKQIITFLSLISILSIGCRGKKPDPNKETEYHIYPTSSQAEIDKIKKALDAENVLMELPMLQRDEQGKIQFIRCWLYSNISWHKSACESSDGSGFKDLRIRHSKNDLQCSIR
jgi:hypothetical protein